VVERDTAMRWLVSDHVVPKQPGLCCSRCKGGLNGCTFAGREQILMKQWGEKSPSGGFLWRLKDMGVG